MADQIEETIKNISEQKGVEGIVVVNSDGIPLRSNLENDIKVKYSSLITQLITKARNTIKNLNLSGDGQDNELTFFRLRTKLHEILVSPEKEYLLIVIQKTTDV
mmetsp:Transcript_4216/g.6219  ORF Transcript_4216/g.6219 Transcript_4216/m.6219 type:complete len:104 (+) Transcript_4216:14-325(+)